MKLKDKLGFGKGCELFPRVTPLERPHDEPLSSGELLGDEGFVFATPSDSALALDLAGQVQIVRQLRELAAEA